MENIELDERYKDLADQVVVSQILAEKSEKFHQFVSENLVEDVEKFQEWLSEKAFVTQGFKNKCPNYYMGRGRPVERFAVKKSIEISLPGVCDSNTNCSPLKITNADLPQFYKKTKYGGAFGSIFFLKDMKFESDGDNDTTENAELKSKLVIKMQPRNFDFDDFIGGQSLEYCFGFNELYTFLYKYSTDEPDYHSDLYVTHFYAPNKEKTKLNLFIVMKKCDIVLSDLIERVHANGRKKFPVKILKDLIAVHILQSGMIHNDVKPANIGYMMNKITGFFKGQFIDFGSFSHFDNEPIGAKRSAYPSTALYLSCNKVPLDENSDLLLGVLDADLREEMEELMEEELSGDFLEETLKTTSKQALPNYGMGAADNCWSMAMTAYECILGKHPVIEILNQQQIPMSIDAVFQCIKETDFYAYFINSDVYKTHYDNEEFAPVLDFMKVSFIQDVEKREEELLEFGFDKKEKFGRYKIDEKELKEELCKYYDFE